MNRPQRPRPEQVQSIASVVVAYQPDAGLMENLRRILVQNSRIIIVDNGSAGDAAEIVAQAAKLPGVHVILNQSNLGIAAALNIGVRHALQAGCEWIATFDQDSTVPDHYFEGLIHAYQACPELNKVGMIAPGAWREPDTTGDKPLPSDQSWSYVPAALTSGCLIKPEMFEVVGFFDDDLFIDYVDVEFCLRLQKGGFKILAASVVELGHELGEKQTRKCFGFQVSFRIHNAWRYYYIMRNRLVLFRLYYADSPRWIWHDISWMPLELGRILCLEQGRWPKMMAACRGIADGLLGRKGRHPDFPPKK